MGDFTTALTSLVAVSGIVLGGTLVHGVILNGVLGSLFGKGGYIILGWRFWVYGGLLYAIHTAVVTGPALLQIRSFLSL